MSRSAALALLVLASGCNAGGLGVDPPADAAPVVADPDAAPEPADAAPADAEPDPAPDAAPSAVCELPQMAAGVSTLSGCDASGAADGARGFGTFANPVNVARGPGGLVYVADFDNDRVRVIAPDGQVITLVAQTGFAKPFGLAVAADGTLYVGTDDNDSGAHSIETGTVWKIDGQGAATVVARDLGRPRGLLVLPDGDLVLSDQLHHDLRLLDPDSGAITPLAGERGTPGFADAVGADARFDMPYGVALLPNGHVAVADYNNHRIREVALDGTVTTLAGAGTPGATDGPALTATLSHPEAVAIDDSGAMFIADTDNFVVRAVRAGEVSTVVGSGTGGWLDATDLRAAEVYGLEGLAVSADGETLWIADGSRGEDVPYNRVRVAAMP